MIARRSLIAFAAGLLFGVGLLLSGMTDPERVIGFLDLAEWDPSLAFVMGGALAIALPAFQLSRQHEAPRFDAQFHEPQRRVIDMRLVVGASIFGVGWGLAGLCPGPAIVSMPTGRPEVLAFLATMWIGLFTVRALTVARIRRAHQSEPVSRAAAMDAPESHELTPS